MSRSIKALEKSFVIPLLKSLDLDPADLNEDDRESPDFLLQTAREDIGIEVTEVHRSADELGNPAWSGDCEAVVKAARRRWIEEGLPTATVMVHFEKDGSAKGSDRRALGDELVGLVESVMDRGEGQYIFGNGPGHLVVSDACPGGVASVLVTRTNSLSTSKWEHVWTTGRRSLEPERLQARIDHKAKKAPRYRSAASSGEVWLVLSHDHHRVSMVFHPSQATLSHHFAGPFDRVFLVGRYLTGYRADELTVLPDLREGASRVLKWVTALLLMVFAAWVVVVIVNLYFGG